MRFSHSCPPSFSSLLSYSVLTLFLLSGTCNYLLYVYILYYALLSDFNAGNRVSMTTRWTCNATPLYFTVILKLTQLKYIAYVAYSFVPSAYSVFMLTFQYGKILRKYSQGIWSSVRGISVTLCIQNVYYVSSHTWCHCSEALLRNILCKPHPLKKSTVALLWYNVNTMVLPWHFNFK